MIFNEHSNLKGKHASFSPSTYYWLNDTEDEAIKRYCAGFAASVGTILHSLAEFHIRQGVKMTKSDKKYIPAKLLDSGIPTIVVDRLQIDDIFANLSNYINDGVGFRMTPEVPLYYSDLFFGHADTIAYDESERFLRIHDLKNGATPAKIDQLVIYDALFRLEYCPILHVRPEDISSELRIYQGGEIDYCSPKSDDVIFVMNHIKALDKTMTYLKGDRRR